MLRQRQLAASGGSPLVDPALFRQRAFAVGVASSVVFYAGMASFFLVLAVYLQDGCGLSALDSGLVFTALAAGYLAASVAAEALAPRFGRQVLAAGGIVRAVSLVGLAMTVAAIGVAAIGALFHGAIGPNADFAGAFELALLCVAAAMVQLLPGPRGAADETAAPTPAAA